MLLQGQSQSVTDSGRHQADIGEQGARCCSTILSREAAAGVSMARLEDGHDKLALVYGFTDLDLDNIGRVGCGSSHFAQ